MYKNVSTRFKSEEGVLSRGRINSAYILTPLNEKIEKFVQGQFMLQNKCSVDGKIIGNVIAKNFECQIYNAKNYDLINKEIDVYTGLIYSDGTKEYVPWGKFIVDTYENVESSDYISIKAMDYMVKFNPDYIDNNVYPCLFKDWVVNFSNFYEVELGQLSYKLTTDNELNSLKRYYILQDDIYELVENPTVNELSTYYEVDLEDLPNQNFVISETPEILQLTGRQILKSVAEMFGCFATIGRDNKLYFKLKEETDVQIPKSPTLHSLVKNEVYGPINTVVLKLGQVEGENITRRNEESIEEFGENIIQIEDNVFLNSQEKREAAIDDIFEKLNGFGYVDFSADWNNFMFLDSGDAIQVQNKDDDSYFDTILLNQTLYVPNTTKSIISAPSESKAEEKYQFTAEQKQADRYVEFRVDKVEGQITATTQKTNEIYDDLNDNYYNKTNINMLLENAETGLTNTFSEAGGNNVLRNTSYIFEETKTHNEIQTSNVFQNLNWLYSEKKYDGPYYANVGIEQAFNISELLTGQILLDSNNLIEIDPSATYKYSFTNPISGYVVYAFELDENLKFIGYTNDYEIAIQHEIIYGENTSISFSSNAKYLLFMIDKNSQSELLYTIEDIQENIDSIELIETKEVQVSEEGLEYWEGKAVRTSNDKAINFNSALIQEGSFSQEQLVPNGSYSISFYYKKLIELANTSVKINDVEYELDSLEDKQFYTGEIDNETNEYITQPIEVSSGHIKIEFISDTNNALEIWDLMCNVGTIKLAYSQNANEVTTDTVNISKGITITSSYMETIFKANANGIRILTLNKATIAYFTDKGLSTNELVVKNKAQITGVLMQEVDDQTWITKL